MKNLIKIATVMPVLLALLLSGCALEDPGDPTGTVNPPSMEDPGTTRYAAIGNSLTAGYMDSGLMQAGQINSYPRLIANQLGLDNTEFSQPWVAFPGIGTSASSGPSMVAGVLHFDGIGGIGVVAETPAAEIQSILLAATQPTAYHNLGVPGAWLIDGRNAIDAATSFGALLGQPNTFFEFINRSNSLFGSQTVTLAPGMTTESGSMHYKAIAKGGALTTVWLGNNDILGAATGGNPGAPQTAPITSLDDFTAEYTLMLQTLAGGLANRNGFPATIVTATIPGITAAPFFMPESLFDNVVQSQISVSWPGGYEEADVQFVLFPALSFISSNPPATPIPSRLTLTDVEAQLIEDSVTGYNAVITGVSAEVNASGFAKCGVMDADALLNGLSDTEKTHVLLLWFQIGDTDTAAGMTAFSLDGVHPNNKGYGHVANGFIDKINELDGTSIPQVDVTALSWDPTYGVTSPAPTSADQPRKISVTPEAAAAMGAIFR
ncbi:MAG: hypothetical protein QNL91_11605 [Candidatus Krumholzibacteria bacterium]|nr:hypothetical protein [Candidatus Krumholzibacteria bacterium]